VIPAAAQLKRGAGDAGSICGWLFLFQLAEKANLGMARNINVNDVASFDLDQFAGIAYKMQLRFLILHDLCLSPPILESCFDRLAARKLTMRQREYPGCS